MVGPAFFAAPCTSGNINYMILPFPWLSQKSTAGLDAGIMGMAPETPMQCTGDILSEEKETITRALKQSRD